MDVRLAPPDLDAPAARLEQRYAAAMAELLELRARLDAIEASSSWRLTAPLRAWRARRLPPPEPPPPAPVRSDAGPAPEIVSGHATVIALGGDAAARTALSAIPAGLPFTVASPADADPDDGWIVLWDGVSRPAPGWLAALAGSFAAFPDLGMAGAVLLDTAGRIASAGLAVEPDGTLLPLGAGSLPDDPELAHAAEVDALPPGAAMLPAPVWRRSGGLDPAIASLPHAMADLALRLGQAGMRVVRQPFARLTLAPAAAPAAEEAWTQALGAWHVRQRLLAREGGLALLERTRPLPPRVLFVEHFVPLRDRDAGSADLHTILRVLVGLGWQPTLLPLDDLARLDGYVDDLRRRGVRVASGGAWRDAAGFLATQATPFDLLVVSRATLASGRLFAQLRRHSPGAPLLFNTVDLHFVRLERQAMLTRSAPVLAEAARIQRAELAAVASADRTLVMSETERDILARLLPLASISVMPLSGEVPGRAAPFAGRRGVVFVGGFRHAPNVDAVLHFVADIWPAIAAKLDTTLRIVGADAPPEVLALAGPGIEVCGHVADLDTVLATCRLSVAPLRFGAGIKGKIITSMAAGLPCVASPLAVEGMGLEDGAQLRIAGTPAAFADAVCALHEDAAEWLRLSDAGVAFAERHFSVAAARRRIAGLLETLGLPSGRAA